MSRNICESVSFLAKLYNYDVAKCLQVKRGKCSLHVALYHALFNNDDEFVYSFIEKVDMKKFLDRHCLDHLYDQVSKRAFVYNLCTNIQFQHMYTDTVRQIKRRDLAFFVNVHLLY